MQQHDWGMSNTYPATCLGSGMRSTSPKQFLRYGNHTGYCCQALSTPKITYPFLFIAKLICSGKAARCSEKTHSDGRWLWCKNAYRGDGKKPKTSLWTKAWSQFILCKIYHPQKHEGLKPPIRQNSFLAIKATILKSNTYVIYICLSLSQGSTQRC